MVMRTNLMVALVGLCAAAQLGCGEDPAAPRSIQVAISTDVSTPRRFDGLQVKVSRDGVGVLSNQYDYEGVSGLPDTLLLTEADALTEEQLRQSIRITVEGQLHGETTISRSASLNFADRAVLLRMPLCNACLGVVCDSGQTCKSGVCVAESIDSASLPTDDGAQALEDPECPGKGPICAGKCGDPGCGACPTDLTVSVEGLYTIDATEVTREAFEAWLDTNPHPVAEGVIPECAVATSFYPESTCLADPSVAPGSRDKHPQVCVLQCAAVAYCAWAGKHLCRGVGDVYLPLEPTKTLDSEWYRACAGAEEESYPYGPDRMDGFCNDTGTTTVPVDSPTMCVGNLPGLVHMTGNVAEWGDSCEGSICWTRGGNYTSVSLAQCGDVFNSDRKTVYPQVGFRCCGAL
jgi:hypothetical protein